MIWANGIEYPIIIGGKPPISIPDDPDLLRAHHSVLGARLLLRHVGPQLACRATTTRCSSPSASRRFSTDKFFISVEAADPQFDVAHTRRFLEALHPAHVEAVEEEV